MKVWTIVVACLVALSGCDKEPESKPTAESSKTVENAAVKAKMAKEAIKTNVDSSKSVAKGLAEAASGKRNFEFSIEGIDTDTVSGATVMTQVIGPRVMYKMAGDGAMHTITLNEGKKHDVGTFEVYSLQLLWTETQYACRKPQDGSLKLVVKKAGNGIRGEMEGDVLCSKVNEDDEAVKARVKGWFVD